MWFVKNQFAKKRTKNHSTVVIGGPEIILPWWFTQKNHPIVVFWGPDAAFLLIFKPHKLGDLFKINSQKNAQKITPLLWLEVRKSSLRGDLPKNNHPAVVFWGPGAAFLLIFKPHTLGDFLKINSQKKRTKNHECVVIGGPEIILTWWFT